VASRRITSVLFGDLVGFTPLSESRDQEDVRELLSRYFDECSRIVARYGGTVEKFIGDAVMAVWGVPTTHEDDAERSVRAGLELVAAVTALGSDIGVADLAMRVGIVTGEVAVTVGAEMQGMVAGDPVNTASRVQSVAAPGQVWVDETTRLLTSASISYADVGSHTLKGKAEPMPLWSARAVVGTAGGAQRADGLEAPLVGRDRELRMVKELFHGVAETGRPSLLIVSGDAGVGKTRLGWEFSKYTDGLADACRWHSGKCVSYGEGVAYYAVAEAVRSRLETGLGATAPDDPGASVDTAELVERGLAAYVDDPDERAYLAPRVGALLGAGGAAGHAREDLFAAWTTFFERVSQGTEPVVMLIDDAQYADEGLVLFLEHLMAAATFPCFVMLLARPELVAERPGLVTNRRATVLHLEAFTDQEMAQLVDGLVQGLPPRVRDQLVERAEGIATYAVETVRALIDRDLVVPRGGAYVLADPDTLDLAEIGAPASLQALISARLDRLAPEQRRVVDRASVAGDSVDPPLLAELCADVSDLDSVLADLVRAQILTVERDRLSSEQGRYQFVQSALRQVAYATLSRRDRKQAHLGVLALLERDGSDDLASVMAQHGIAAIEAAPDAEDVPLLTERAAGLLRRAADRATALGAPREACGHLRRALDLATDDRVRCEVMLALAQALHQSGEYAEAIERADAARAGFAAVGDLESEAMAAVVESDSRLRGPADYAGALALIEPYERRMAETHQISTARAQVLRAYSSALGSVGQVPLETMATLVNMADRLGDGPLLARAINNLSVTFIQQHGPLLAELLLQKSVEVARECHDLITWSMGLSNIGSHVSGEDLARSRAALDEARVVAVRAGNTSTISLVHANGWLVRWLQGDWDDVLAARDFEGLELDEQAMTAALVGFVLAARGESPAEAVDASARRGGVIDYWWLVGVAVVKAFDRDPGVAGALREALDATYDSCGLGDDFPACSGFLMDAAVRLGEVGLLERLRQILDEDLTAPQAGLRGHRALVGALMAGDSAPDDEVEAQFQTAVREYDGWGSAVFVARARAAYGRWLQARGRADEAATLLDAARETYAALGATAWLEELDAFHDVSAG
jgi:class 3 adenylate cyclase/tetratricopeptide (TPR) repeat protein